MKLRYILILVLLSVNLLKPSASFTQTNGFTETFDDPTLPGWEHTANTTALDGILHIPAGDRASHGGDWHNFTMSVRLRYNGSIALTYRVHESQSYIFLLNQDMSILQSEMAGAVENLATLSTPLPPDEWINLDLVISDNSHTVLLNEAQILTVQDEGYESVAGGFGFEVLDGFVDIDSLSVIPVEEVSVTDSTEVPEQSSGSGETSLTWTRAGGPPGGLGYDIRYNFADPNIWYVTDNFAGVHISTDNGLTWHPSNNGIPSQMGPTADWRPIFSLTVDPLTPQIIWAGTDVTGHIYKSTDGGQTWMQKDNGIVNEWDELTFRGFTIDPQSSDIVYAMGETSIVSLGGHLIWSLGDGGVIYKTTDGGENWTKIWDGGVPSALTRYMWIDPSNSNVLYVSTGIFDRGGVGESETPNDVEEPWGGLGVLKSTDGGITWQILGKEHGFEGLYVGSLYMHPQNPDILLAAVGHEMGFTQIQYLQQEGYSPAGIYRTTDGGETLEHVFEPPLERVNEEFSAVEICTIDPNIAYAGSAAAIYRSEDSGQTWTQVTSDGDWGPPGVRAGWPIDLQCDPRDSNRLFANNYQGGAFLSENGGQTWVNASQGYTGAQIFNIVVDPTNADRVYVIGRSGGWRTDDGGLSWQGLRNFQPGEPHPILAEWGTIALNPSNPDQIWASDGDGPVIIESQNRGDSWTVHVPPEGIRGTVLTYAFTTLDPNLIYAGYGDLCMRGDAPCNPAGGIIVSHDTGQTWTLIDNETLKNSTIGEIAIDPANPQVIYAVAAENGLFKSSDGGNTWIQLDLSSLTNPSVTDPDMLFAPQRTNTIAIDPTDSQHILLGLHMLGIFSSFDGGSRWQMAYTGLEANSTIHDILFDPNNSQIVYASDRNSGVYRSTDGGQTWVKFSDGLNNRATMWLAISADSQRLYVATDGEGVYRINLTN